MPVPVMVPVPISLYRELVLGAKVRSAGGAPTGGSPEELMSMMQMAQ